MVRKSIPILVGAALLLARAPAADATMFNFPGGYFSGGDSGLSGYDLANISAAPAGYAGAITGSVYSGGDALVSGSTTIDAYCVDLSHDLYVGSNVNYALDSDTSPTTVSYFGTLYSGANGAATITALEHLASNALSLVNNADTSAAFQIAIWDIAFGSSSSGFMVSANGADAAAVNADVATFLSLAASGGAITEQLTLLQDDGTNMGAIQNLVTFTPVPLPGAAWLLLSGLAGAGALVRRRRSLAHGG
jgi:hypothetical protein